MSVGAIGSGHLATLTAAAEALERALLAICFWEPLGPWVEENLAFTASGATELRFVPGRLGVALRYPGALARQTAAGRAVVPPGASSASGVLGMVRAGLELAEQIRRGALPPVDRVYIPLGTAGAAAGLSLGLALGGVRPALHAVAAVERLLSPHRRARGLVADALAAMQSAGRHVPDVEPVPIRIDRRMLGPGYGHATEDSLRERAALSVHGIGLEPVYGGKAMAALRADAPDARGERVLLWLTSHRTLPRREGWESRLPPALRRRLHAARSGRVGRRRWIIASGASAAALALGLRVGLHRSVEGWRGRVLFEWEGAVLSAAADAIVPAHPGGAIPGGVSPDAIAVNVDNYLVGMPDAMQVELHGLFALVEHGTSLGGDLGRFTRLGPAARRDFLRALADRGGDLGHAARGLRDLCYLGYYQDPRAWPQLAYPGPWVAAEPRENGRYGPLCAPEGAAPPGWSS